MNIKEYKNYLPFAVSVILFLIVMIYGGYLYTTWEQTAPQEEMEIEVNLPIVNWSKYTSLSKQYKIDKVD